MINKLAKLIRRNPKVDIVSNIVTIPTTCKSMPDQRFAFIRKDGADVLVELSNPNAVLIGPPKQTQA